MLFEKGKQIEDMLKLYGIDLPCDMHFVGDSDTVMFKFDNLPKVEEELIIEEPIL